MGAASSAKPIEGPKTPMELVASLKKFVDATEINFDDAFCNREDIDAFIGGLNVIMQHAKVVRELTPEAEEEAAVAEPGPPAALRFRPVPRPVRLKPWNCATATRSDTAERAF